MIVYKNITYVHSQLCITYACIIMTTFRSPTIDRWGPEQAAGHAYFIVGEHAGILQQKLWNGAYVMLAACHAST